MASNLGIIHNRMIALCGITSGGIGVRREWLFELLQRQFPIINNSPPLPTPIAPLSVKLSVVSATLKAGVNCDELDAVLTLDIRPTADPKKSFRAWTLSVTGVKTVIAEDSYNQG